MTSNISAETAGPVALNASPISLSRRTWLAEIRALLAVVRREWIIFRRYPSWIVALILWPVIFPMVYIFTARSLAGPDGSEPGLVHPGSRHIELPGLYRYWYNHLDVAERGVMGCRFCAARRANARHVGDQLVDAHLAFLLSAG